jgi:hypothetical protein
MSNISERDNEFQLIKKVMLGLLILNLSTLLFSYMVTTQTGAGSTGLGCSQYTHDVNNHQVLNSTNPDCNIINIDAQLANSTYNFITAFNYKAEAICPISNFNISSVLGTNPSCYNYFTPITNTFAPMINFIVQIGRAIYYLFDTVYLIIQIVYFSTIGLVPAIFYGAHLGVFSTLFTIIYGFSIVIIIIYGVYVVLNRFDIVI